jgi:hypothetical protein
MQLLDPLCMLQSQEMVWVLIKRQTNMRYSPKLYLPMLVCRNFTTFCRQTNRVCLILALTSTRSSSTSKRRSHARKSNICKLFSVPKYLLTLWKTRRTIKPTKARSTLWEIWRWDHKLQYTNSAETHEAEQKSKLPRMTSGNVPLFCYNDWFVEEPCKIWCSKAKKNVLIWSLSYAPRKNGEPNRSFLKKKSF